MKDDNAKKELENDINEMTAMLDSYVSFVRSETPEPIENINLNKLLKDIIKNIDFEKHNISFIEKNIIKTSGRPLQLKRAIQNIIDNSIRYSNKLNIEIFLNDDGCAIVIEDNGPGIPIKNYEDVFKPFFSLDPSRNKLKGESGLGLSITRDIIRAHGGEIKLSKSSYGGLKSLIQLPI